MDSKIICLKIKKYFSINIQLVDIYQIKQQHNFIILNAPFFNNFKIIDIIFKKINDTKKDT